MIEIPFLKKSFSDKSELIKYLKDNRQRLNSLKKLQETTAPVKFEYTFEKSNSKAEASKAEGVNSNPTVEVKDPDLIRVKVVMNTTNYMDSHLDVHIPGLWKKTLEQSKGFYHLQEHISNFDHVIAYPEDVKVYTEYRNWTDLGADYPGQTQCLIFETVIRKDVNPYMFNLYLKNRVRNHSVGMRYVQCEIAIYDENDEKEMDFWNKYITQVVNREKAERYGFFWVVTEAILREGSSVLFGSNDITPTQSVEIEVEEDKEAKKDDSIQDEPPSGIQNEPPQESKKLSNNLLLI